MIKCQIRDAVLYRGDSFEILQEISEADAMITDPPYGFTCNDWDYDIDLDKFWQLAKTACRKNAPFAIFCQMSFGRTALYEQHQNVQVRMDLQETFLLPVFWTR